MIIRSFSSYSGFPSLCHVKLIRVTQFLLVGTGNHISAVRIQIREPWNGPSVKDLNCLPKYRNFCKLTKYSVNLKTLLQQVISEPEFYGDLVYRFRKIVGKSNFSEQFRKLINRYKRIGYSLDIMRQTACLVVNPIIVDGYASLFNCTTAVRA